jgi:glutathione S-transferase
MPNIHIYGVNQSPWVQAVLLTLHMKRLKYSLASLLHPQTILESYRQGKSSPIHMPAMWYDGECIYETTNIIEFLDAKHPQTPSLFNNTKEDVVAVNLKKVFKLFSYALTRVAGQKRWQFWYEWSIVEDNTTSIVQQFLSRLSRPFSALYFWVLIHLARIFMFTWSEENFRNPIAYFSEIIEKNGGEYVDGSHVTYLDIVLLGHFQCMFSGSNGLGALSKEVIPILDQYPSMWKWLKSMHKHPLLVDYPFMFSRCDETVIQRTGEPRKGGVTTETISGQIIYWFGVICLLIWWPFTLFWISLLMGARMWKTKGGYIDDSFKFRFQKLQ